MTLPPRTPGPFGGVDVRQGVADRPEAAPEIASELIRRQLLGGIEHVVASPVVIVEQRSQFLQVHRFSVSASCQDFPQYVASGLSPTRHRGKRFLSTKSRLAGRSASRRMYQGNQYSPYEI